MVFNFRASYSMEIDKIVDSLVRDARQKIAIVYQDDAFGQDGLSAAQKALKKHNLTPAGIATVQRNSDNIAKAFRIIDEVRPNGLIIVSAYVSSAALSKTILRNNLDIPVSYTHLTLPTILRV